MTLEEFAKECMMTLEEFAKVCMIRIVEEHAEAPAQALEPWRRHRLWLYTHGLEKFDLPELELRNVHPFWSEEAASQLTEWAYKCSRRPYGFGEPVREGQENTREEMGLPPLEMAPFEIQTLAGLHVTVRLTRSTSDHWHGHRTGCLWVRLRGLEMGCSCCECGSGAGTVH